MRHLLNTPNLPRSTRIEAGAECLMDSFGNGHDLRESLADPNTKWEIDRLVVDSMFRESGAAEYILDDAEWAEVLALCAKKLSQDPDES